MKEKSLMFFDKNVAFYLMLKDHTDLFAMDILI